MKVINQAMRCGKTHKIVNRFLWNNVLLIVMNEQERKRIIKQYRIPVEKSKDIISWQNIQEKLLGTNKAIYIDNVDYFLQEYFRGRTEWVTMNADIEKDSWIKRLLKKMKRKKI